jgi:hypothetical protein
MLRLRAVLLGSVGSLLAAACSSEAEQCDTEECGGSSDASPDDATDSSDPSDPSDTADTTGGGPQAARGIPCDVQDVIDRHCTSCHDAMPMFGAPMSLFDVDGWRVPAATDPSKTVAELAAIRIVDDENPMPATGQMPADDLEILQRWIADGTPESSEACGGGPVEPDPVGPDALPCEPTVEFLAHDGDAPFQVPAQGADNLYQCFTFASPVADTTQAIAWAPITDDERVLHHWILFRTNEPQVDGGSGPCNMPSDALFVAGWAPGGGNYELPENVGLELGGPDVSFILQVHYHNVAQHSDAFDRSGVAMCVIDEPREHTAGIVTLGTVGIDIPAGVESHAEQGVCPSWITSYLPQPLHIIASFPHMHELGRAIETTILRGGESGPEEDLIDVPNFSFESQTYYAHEPEVLLQPGDALRTTCTYNNEAGAAVHVGEATEDEMCFNFVMVYPIEDVGETRQCGLI